MGSKSSTSKDHIKYEDPSLLHKGAWLLVSLNALRRN